ncbi:Periplasmic binding protein-like I protein, partial [Dioscorea alata]
GTWPQVRSLVDIGSKSSVPMILLEAIPPLTSTLEPYTILMSSRATSHINCAAQLVQNYKWRRAIVVYEDDEYSSISGSINLILYDALLDVGSGVEDRVAFSPLRKSLDPKLVIRQELERVNNHLCKVFIVLKFSKSSAIHFFKEAHTLGMTSKGYVWIVVDDDVTNLLDSSLISSYTQGVLGIKDHFIKSTKSYQQFHEEFHKSSISKYGKEAESEISSLLGYDAVSMISIAEHKGATLLDGILSSNFIGLTGYAFRSEKCGNFAAKKGDFSAFQIINIVGKSYRELGLWFQGHGFHEEIDQKVDVFGHVYWPGGLIRAPGGWGKLKIGVPARTTFNQFVKVDYDDEGRVKLITGYCIDVFMETLKKLKYDLMYEFHPFHGTYEDLIDQVTVKNFDMVIGDLTILSKRLEKVDFTQPYVGSGLAMLMKVKSDHKAWVFLEPFTVSVWMCTVAAFFYTVAIVWCLERKVNSEFNSSWCNQIKATLWLIFTAFFNFKKIVSNYTFAVIMVSFFVFFIMSQSYTASLSSILTTQKLEPVVSFNKIGCDPDAFVIKCLEEVLGYPSWKIHKIKTENNYPEAFESGKITTAFLETPYLRVFLSRHKDYTYQLGGFGFAFPKGSPLAVGISKAILELSEDGVLKYLENKWFSFSFTNYPSPEKTRSKDSLSLDHLWGLFIIAGAITTFIFLFFHLNLHARNCQSVEKENAWVSDGDLQLLSIHHSSSITENLDEIYDEITHTIYP